MISFRDACTLGLWANLPERQMQVWLLTVTGHTPEEIAARLGISRGAVDTALHRARKSMWKVQDQLQRCEGLHHFTINEGIPNRRNCNPRTPKFAPDNYGVMQRVVIGGARCVTADDLNRLAHVEV